MDVPLSMNVRGRDKWTCQDPHRKQSSEGTRSLCFAFRDLRFSIRGSGFGPPTLTIGSNGPFSKFDSPVQTGEFAWLQLENFLTMPSNQLLARMPK